jgi:DNA-binding NtrC family response regulator/tetratricopeptide (TPR) repeat protein
MARAHPSSPTDPLARLLGEAPALHALRAQIRHLARFDAIDHPVVPTVLLQGETGTGKGLVARVMHDSGPRAQGPFIEVNCAAIPDTLFEAELFGVEAGAFTDAKHAKPGLFEAASGGTLFLDEIDALPLPLQGKCLTAIEAKRVRRVGAVVEHPIDIKLIAATQVALNGQVLAGRFRADLYHRLAVVVLELPPLRLRGDDILVLVRAFLQQQGVAYGVGPQRLSKAAEAWLLGYHWPGNVRELSHLLERVALLETAMVIDPESLSRRCLPPSVPDATAVSLDTPSSGEPLHEAARLAEALRQSGGNLAAAARLLGMSRGGLRHRLHKYGLTRPSRHHSSPLVRKETSAKDMSPPSTTRPTVSPSRGAEQPVVPSPQGGEGQGEGASARRDERHVGLTREPSPAPAAGWEPKPVAVLAIEATWPDMSAAGAGPYEPWTVASRWEQRIAEKVAGFGGVILQGSPSLLLVGFGLPQTLEQLPHRAVQAALAIRRLAAEARASTGEVAGPVVRLAGHLGTLLVAAETGVPPGRWLAVGETLALPVRLLGHAAPGEVLVSASMARQTDGWVEVQTRPLSSGAEPLLAHTVIGLLPRQAALTGSGRRARTPFLGRAHELVALQAALAQVEGGRGQVVGVVGEPGMGKSRLLAEWRQSLTAYAVTCLEGHCWSYGSATPYLPVLDLLRGQFGITPADGAEGIVEKVHRGLQAVGLTPDDWAPYLLHLLGVPVGIEWVADVGPESLKAKTFEVLRQLILHGSQQRPVVLAVEDLHWMDPTSEAWLTSLVERLPGASIMCLATYRPGYRPPWLDKSYATQLTLSPLSPQDSVQVVRAVLETETVPAPLAQAILAKAQGNPFFLEEMAQTLVDQGTLRREGGVALPPTLQLPATVQGVLAARIDRLPPEEKRLLQTAAVIGTDIPFALLRAIADVPEEALHRGLAYLQAAEFLYETHRFPEHECTFKHVLTQQVAYETLLQERRRTLHTRIVEILDGCDPARLTEQVDRLAHHAIQGEVWDKAVTYCQQAGARAYDRAAFREAVAYFDQALQALDHLRVHAHTGVRAIDLRFALRRALTALGEYGRSLALMGEAEAMARALDDRPRLGRVLASMTRVLRITGNLDGAIAAGRQALDLAVELGDSTLQVQASQHLGEAYYIIGDFGQAAELMRRNVEAAYSKSGTPSTDLRIRSRAWLAWTLSVLGAFAEGRRHGEEALRLATLEGRGETPILAHGRLGHLYLAQGDLGYATRLLEQGLALCRASGSRSILPAITGGLGSAYALQGRLAEGRALLEEAISENILMGAQQRSLWVAWLSEVCRLAGRAEEAWEHAHQALDLARQQKARGDEALALHQLGTVHTHADPPDADQAETYYLQALALAEELGMRPLQAHCHLGLGTLYVLIGRSEQPCAQLSAAIKLYRAMDMTFWLPRAESALAQVVGARGQQGPWEGGNVTANHRLRL